MKKVIIGRNVDAEKSFTINLEGKKERLEALLEYMQGFIDIKDFEFLESNIKNHFIESFEEKYRSDFPPIVNLEKRLELCGVDIQKLDKLISDYNAIQVQGFNAKTRTAPKPNFDIYANDETAVNRYESTKKLCDILNDLRTSQTIYPANVVQGVAGIIGFNFMENKFDINISYINSIPQRNY